VIIKIREELPEEDIKEILEGWKKLGYKVRYEKSTNCIVVEEYAVPSALGTKFKILKTFSASLQGKSSALEKYWKMWSADEKKVKIGEMIKDAQVVQEVLVELLNMLRGKNEG